MSYLVIPLSCWKKERFSRILTCGRIAFSPTPLQCPVAIKVFASKNQALGAVKQGEMVVLESHQQNQMAYNIVFIPAGNAADAFLEEE